jgi:hypothetical protein
MARLEGLGAPLERYLQFRVRVFVIFKFSFFAFSCVFKKEIGFVWLVLLRILDVGWNVGFSLVLSVWYGICLICNYTLKKFQIS